MDEDTLRAEFTALQPALQAWGFMVRDHVLDELGKELKKRLIETPIEYFLKIWPVAPRVKTLKSFLDKALWRNKNYKNPIVDITDLVGVRFVALVLADLVPIQAVIERSPIWTFELARDFEEERRQKPHHFDYQSIHYTVAAKPGLRRDETNIPEGMTCEIQVRTLMQHAYSELVHDTIYKPTNTIAKGNSKLSREVAKSMALIETTDSLFTGVSELFREADQQLQTAATVAFTVFEKIVGAGVAQIDIQLQRRILDAYRPWLETRNESALSAYFELHPHLAGFLRREATVDSLYAQPALLIPLSLLDDELDAVVAHWPLQPKHLRPVFTQLGISTDELSG